MAIQELNKAGSEMPRQPGRRYTADESRQFWRQCGRRFRWARRNAGYPTATAYAREFGLSARSVARLERGLMRRTGPVLQILMPLCDRTVLSLDRLLCGGKPDPTSWSGRIRAGDRSALAEMRAQDAKHARYADVAEAWLDAREGRA